MTRYSVIAGSGELDEAEFSAGFKAELGATDAQCAKTFKALDEDSSGSVSLSELNDFFKKMDTDGENEKDSV